MQLANKKLKAFSLTELLVVLVIIGILTLLALPVLMPAVSQAKSTEAKLQLGHLHQMAQSYFYLHSKYSAELEDIGFEQAKLVSEGGTAHYKIEIIEATHSTFKARATSITDFDRDGIIDVWEIDQDKNLKQVTKD
jgi:type IV pilus assembly protein PilE